MAMNEILVLSAKSKEQLHEEVKRLIEVINAGIYSEDDFTNICYTLQVGREHMKERLAVISDSLEHAKELLLSFYQDEVFSENLLVSDKGEMNITPTDSKEEIDFFLNEMVSHNKFHQIASLWIKGFDFDWDVLYQTRNLYPHCVSLPSYPFEKEKYWIQDVLLAEKEDLLSIENQSNIYEQKYHIYSKDRRALKADSITFTTVISCISKALMEAVFDGVHPVMLQDVVMERPVTNDDLVDGVDLALEAEDEITWRLIKKEPEDNEVLFGSGIAVILEEEQLEMVNIEEYESMCRIPIVLEDTEVYCTEAFTTREEEVFYFKLSDQAENGSGLAYLESCLQYLFPKSNSGCRYQMQKFENMVMGGFKNLIAYVIVEKVQTGPADKWNISIVDQEGCLVAEFFNVLLALNDFSDDKEDYEIISYKESWVSEPLGEENVQNVKNLVLFVSDDVDIEYLQIQIDAEQTYIVKKNENVLEALKRISSTIDVIDGIWYFSTKNIHEDYHNLFQMIQAISKLELVVKRILIAGVYSDNYEKACLDSWIGMERSLKLVLPQTTLHVIFTNEDDTVTLTSRLQTEMRQVNPKSVWYYHGVRNVTTLQEEKLDVKEDSVIKEEGVYCILGGMGGLGTIFAKWLAQKYRARIILLGRSPRNEKKYQLLAKTCIHVDYMRVNMLEKKALEHVLLEIKHKYGMINGIFHSAGLAGGSSILDKNFDEFEEILKPNIEGTVILEELAKNLNVDFIAYFCSNAAVLGDFGSCCYAMGKRFQMSYVNGLDRKLKRIIVNWPLWKGDGMKLEDEQANSMYMKSSGQKMMDEENGTILFEQLIKQNNRQHLICYAKRDRMERLIHDINSLKKNTKKNPVMSLAKQTVSKKNTNGLTVEQKCVYDLKEIVSKILGFRIEKVTINADFAELGFDSISLEKLADDISSHYSVMITPNVFFNYPTIDKLSKFLCKKFSEQMAELYQELEESVCDERLEKPVMTKKKRKTRSWNRKHIFTRGQAVSLKQEKISIIGMSGRFPESRNVDELWNIFQSGREVTREVIGERDGWSEYNESTKNDSMSGKRKMGAVPGIFEFDPLFFAISPREADRMDPKQRLLLEETWKALEDASYSRTLLDSEKIGVFIGAEESDYSRVVGNQKGIATNSMSALAGRIGYWLNLHGPNLVIDTACSSSLVAFHQACLNIWSGMCDTAIVGGVSILATSDDYELMEKSKMISPDGVCHAFDKKANGMVPAESIAVMILKRETKAVKDHHQIYANVVGSGVNYDGRTNGLTAPSGNSQTQLIVDVCEKFHIDKSHIDLAVTHGTGTKLGDSIEINALAEAFQDDKKEKHCALISFKPNIGHALAASGLVSLIGLVKAMLQEQIPPTINCEEVNEYINWEKSPFYLNKQKKEWTRTSETSRRASVSAFGITGTNAYVVVEDVDKSLLIEKKVERPYYMLCYSAKSEESLYQNVIAMEKYLEEKEDISMANYSFSLLEGRIHLPYRIALIVKNREDALLALKNVRDGIEAEGIYVGKVQNNFEKDNGILEKIASYEEHNLNDEKLLQTYAKYYCEGYEEVCERIWRDEELIRLHMPTYHFQNRIYQMKMQLQDKTETVAKDPVPERIIYTPEVNETKVETMIDLRADNDRVEEALLLKLKEIVSAVTGLGDKEIDETQVFQDMGFDSISISEFTEMINQELSIGVTPDVIFSYAAIEPLKDYLLKHYADKLESKLVTDMLIQEEDKEMNVGQSKDLCIKQLISIVSELMEIDKDIIEADENIVEYGFDSISIVEFVEAINHHFHIAVTPDAIYTYTTLEKLVDYLIQHFQIQCKLDGEETIPETVEKTAPVSMPENVPENNEKASSDEIAVIGMSGRFPDARNVEELWKILYEGKNVVRKVPEERTEWQEAYADFEKGKNRKIGVIPGISEFDPLFFEIAPIEAEKMDPRQRLLLQEMWKGLEDAGYQQTKLAKERVGIFLGAEDSEYKELSSGDAEITSNSNAVMSGRLAYFLNLDGPNMSINTACSSGLVALHEACLSLRNNECDMAIAAAANLLVTPDSYYMMEKSNMLSETGTCSTFDQKADGMVPAEAVAVVILKRVDKAKEDNDRIYATIVGDGINYDGKTNGITAPSGAAQQNLILSVMNKYGVQAEDVGCIVAHGTGTKLGDPIEVNALNDAYQALTKKKNYCALISVKPNLGHAMAASGLVSFISLVMSMRKEMIPATINCDQPNAYIHWDNSPFFINKENLKWQDRNNKKRIAALSALGFSGTNAHVVVKSYQTEREEKEQIRLQQEKPCYLLTFSAKTKSALEQKVNEFREWVSSHEFVAGELVSISYTLLNCRQHFAYRYAVVIKDKEDILQSLAQFSAETVNYGVLGRIDRKFKVKKEREDFIFRQISEMESSREAYEQTSVLLSQAYCEGYEESVLKLFANEVVTLESVSFYPFEREHYWLTSKRKEESSKTVGMSKIHPMIHNNLSDFTVQKYTSVFDGNEFFLKEHCIDGVEILPGVAYLEMAYTAAVEAAGLHQGATADGEVAVTLKDVGWFTPIAMNQAKIKVCTELELDEKQGMNYTIYTEEEQRNVHSQGYVQIKETGANKQADITQLLKECTDVISAEQCYEQYAKVGLQYGREFRCMDEIHYGENLVVTKLVCGGNIENQNFVMKPGMLDGAFQSTIVFEMNRGTVDDLKIPFAVEMITVHHRCENTMWAVSRAQGQNGSMQSYDIDLYDEKGNLCIEVKKFTSRVLAVDEKRENQVLLVGPRWNEKPLEQKSVSEKVEHIMVLCELSEEELGLDKRAKEMRISKVYHLESADGKYQDYAIQLFRVVKRILENKLSGQVFIQVIYRGRENEEYCAGLIGLLKSAAKENPLLVPQLVCLKDIDNTLAADSLIKELKPVVDELVQYQDGKRYVCTYENLENEELDHIQESKNIAWKEDGVYFITGGTGGLGLLFAREVLNRLKACTLVLTGRSTKESVKDRLDTLSCNENQVVDYRTLDIADKTETQKVISDIVKQYGQLNGVIHAAGRIQDNFIIKKEEQEFLNVLSPKVLGVQNLDEATKQLPLDFMVYFSSTSGMVGNAGQTDYGVANAYMDVFAEERNKKVQNGNRYGQTLSIAWSLWKHGGMVMGEEKEKLLRKQNGIRPLETKEGIQAFYNALASNYHQVGVLAGEENQICKTLFAPVRLKEESVEKKQVLNSQDRKKQAVTLLKKVLSESIKISHERIDENAPMEEYGIDSILTISMTNELEKSFGTLPKTLFFEYQTIAELADYFIEVHGNKVDELIGDGLKNEKAEPAAEARKESPVFTMQQKKKWKMPNQEASVSKEDDIAIIGLAGRYPKASNVEEFWKNVSGGIDCITEIPKERWDYNDYYDSDKKAKGKSYSKWGGFIDGVDEFDPLFFHISPREAVSIDPQERLFLQCVYHAIEDAGYTKDSIVDESRDVGVFAGVMYEDYQLYAAQEQVKGNRITANGSEASIANRISYSFNFQGPSVTMDTMCSTSLTTIHFACQSIHNKECKVAIAGGVNVTVHPNKYLLLSNGKYASSNGKCVSFGEGGDGYVPGEGVGAVILKPLKDALKDKDHIYGVIKATTINHGGKTNGYTVPNPKAQKALIQKALHIGDVDARTVSYIEAHGTGTSLGDPIEITGLTKAFQDYKVEKQSCYIGSVKSNIGHCESAAGIASVTKVLMQMKYKQIAPSLHSKVLNPYIDFAQTPFKVPQQLLDWNRPVVEVDGVKKEYPRRAGISSFGAGGANAHVILEEYENQNKVQMVHDLTPVMIILSAKTMNQVELIKKNLRAYLLEHNFTDQDLKAVGYTLQVGRESMQHRLGFLVRTMAELLDILGTDIEELRKQKDVFYSNLENVNIYERKEKKEISSYVRNKDYEKLLHCWIDGEYIDWKQIYEIEGENPGRISLPAYPFEREQYWLPITADKVGMKEPEVYKSDRISNSDWVTQAIGQEDSKEMLEDELKQMVQHVLQIPVAKISVQEPIKDFGFDSISLVEFVGELNEKFNLTITPDVLYSYSTIQDLAAYLVEEYKQISEYYGTLESEPAEPSVQNVAEFIDVRQPEADTTQERLDLRQSVEDELKGMISRVLQIPVKKVGRNEAIQEFGFDSISLVEFCGEINETFSLIITPDILYSYATVNQLANYLLCEYYEKVAQKYIDETTTHLEEKVKLLESEKTTPLRVGQEQKKTREQKIVLQSGDTEKLAVRREVKKPFKDSEIAIIGMSGRFPNAWNVDEFWSILKNQEEAIEEVHREGWETEPGEDPMRMGVIPGVEEFDPLFFHISPKDAEEMEPKQRILLEESWKALENAGMGKALLKKNKVGFFVGAEDGDYSTRSDENAAIISNHNAVLGARLAYFLNLTGPNLTINTACSSGLVALHEACNSLKNDECDVAIVAGANIITTAQRYRAMKKSNMLSATGHTYAFDKRADGMVPAEAVGVVVLKKLELAKEDGNPILATILGSGINYDGKTNGITAPSGRSQAQLLREIYEKNQINPEEISYIITHGTGTKLGDPIEINALVDAFKGFTSQKNYCALTSTKSNIGHSMAASGIVSLISLVKAMQENMIPASIHCEEINDYIHWNDSPFYINRESKEWRDEGQKQRIGCVSAFGVSGTNAHVVLQSYQPERTEQEEPNKETAYLLMLSARNQEALKVRIADLLSMFEQSEKGVDLTSVSYTLWKGRIHHNCRCAIVCKDKKEACQLLEQALHDEENSKIQFGVVANDFKEKAVLKTLLDNMIKECMDGNNETKKYRELLMLFGQMYCSGYEEGYECLWEGKKCRFVTLPNYPFARNKYWIAHEANSAVIQKDTRLHPLLHENVSDFTSQRYQSVFSDKDALIGQYKLENVPVIPEAFYLEMALAATANAMKCSHMLGEENISITLSEVDFFANLIVDEQKKTIECELELDEEETVFYQIREEETVINQGSAVVYDGVENQQVDLTQWMDDFDLHLTSQEYYENLEELGVTYGEMYQDVQEAAYSEDKILLTLSDHSVQFDEGYLTNLAFVQLAVDGAKLLESVYTGNKDRILLYSIDEMNLYGCCKANMWALIQREGKGYNIYLYDEEGILCIEIRNLLFETDDTDNIEDTDDTEYDMDSDQTMLFFPTWKQGDKTISRSKKDINYYVIVLVELEKEELGFIKVPETQQPDKVILLKSESKDYLDYLTQLHDEVKELMAAKEYRKIFLQVVYCNRGEENYCSGLNGFLKSATKENPKLVVQMVRLENEINTDKAFKLVNEVNIEADESIAFGDGKRYVEKYEYKTLSQSSNAVPWREEGVYLITGGTGGLGLIFAQEILSKLQSCSIVLAGRKPAEQVKEKIQQLQKSVLQNVEYVELDVADRLQTLEVVKEIEIRYGAIHGIIHTAGIIRDSYIIRNSQDNIAEILKPKVLGVKHLDEATRHTPLDFVIYFSSTAGMLGNAGQSVYAAANAYMDAYAKQRSLREGKRECRGKTLSIGWSLWSEGGMAMGKENERLLREQTGIRSLETQEGIDALYESFDLHEPQVGILAGDIKRMKEKAFEEKKLEPKEVKKKIEEFKIEDGGELDKMVKTNRLESDLKNYVVNLLKEILSKSIKLPKQQINEKSLFEEYGIDSISALDMTRVLEEKFGMLPKTLFFEYQTIADLADYFVREHSEVLEVLFPKKEIKTKVVDKESHGNEGEAVKVVKEIAPIKKTASIRNQVSRTRRKQQREPKVREELARNVEPVQQPLPVRSEASAHKKTTNSNSIQDIAIIGLALKAPGADTLDEFWKNLCEGKDCVTQISKERWDIDEYYNPDKNASGNIYSKWGGFINGVDEFDPMFFNISPKEAATMDPQERLFLQCAHAAIEDAGYTKDNLGGEKHDVGVFAGLIYEEYQLYAAQEQQKGNRIAVNSSPASVANRVSYYCNFNGPSMSLDTMCSSSLTTIHLACNSLKLEECSVAIAGGVNISIHPNKYLGLASSKFLSTNGKCTSFGEGGDGFVPSEGVGAVILKPLEKAIEDGDHIYGVIKGTAANHGGKTNGFTVPNPNAQTAVISKALKQGNVNARTISYIEAHGTGTSLGDPIEINGLTKAFREDTADNQFCYIGSVKSNIGHCESAAGIASVAKVLLQLKYKKLVPSIHSAVLNPYIDFEQTPFIVSRELTDWERPVIIEGGQSREYKRIAGISGFGAGGSNAHIVIEEYQSEEETHELDFEQDYIILFSAKQKTQLEKYVGLFDNFMQKSQLKDSDLPSVAYCLQNGREAMNYRIGFTVRTMDELKQKLHQLVKKEPVDVYRGSKSDSYEATAVLDHFSEYIVNELVASQQYNKLIELWTTGINVDWNRLYEGRKRPVKLSLPTYPFAKEKYWYTDIVIRGKQAATQEKTINELKCEIKKQEKIEIPQEKVKQVTPLQEEAEKIRKPGMKSMKIVHSAEQDIKEMINQILEVPTDRIDLNMNFETLGFNSISLVEFSVMLNDKFDVDTTPDIFYSYSTLRTLSTYLADNYGEQLNKLYVETSSFEESQAAVEEEPESRPQVSVSGSNESDIIQEQQKPVEKEQENQDAIAIVGISGRFPGAYNVDEFWNILKEGKEVISKMPEDRVEWQSIYNTGDAEKEQGRKLGVLPGVREFDAQFFEVSPREAISMDPRQRILLQEMWKALEDAGYSKNSVEKNMGVFVGAEESDYHELINDISITANHNAILAARLAYFLNLKGPNMTLNTACSSGLVALHQACLSIRSGECDSAIVGGANILAQPNSYLAMEGAGMLSKDGKCYAFDKRADGMVPAEAVAVVVLKRLDKAIADGNPIYATIVGSGINYDGRTNGITAPSGISQSELIETVYERYHVNPEDISYIVTHGTGTKLGDPIESNALYHVFKNYTKKQNYCALTSNKPNIGHSLGVSGLVSLISIVLSMKYNTIPASIHAEQENDYINWKNSPFYINHENKKWVDESGKARLGAVSAFGMSGTNVHVVVRSYHKDRKQAEKVPYHMLALSAKNETVLNRMIQNLKEYLEQKAYVTNDELAAISNTLLNGRTHFNYRCAFVVRNCQDAIETLEKLSTGQTTQDVVFAKVNRNFEEEDAVLEEIEQLHTVLRQNAVSDEEYKDILLKLMNRYTQGYDNIWERNNMTFVNLPTYSFLTKEYWPEPKVSVEPVKQLKSVVNRTAVVSTPVSVSEPIPVLESAASGDRIMLQPLAEFKNAMYDRTPKKTYGKVILSELKQETSLPKNKEPEKEIERQVQTPVKKDVQTNNLLEKLITSLAKELYCEPSEIDLEGNFMELGLDSIIGVEWIRKLNNEFHTSIKTTKLYQYTNILEFAKYFQGEIIGEEETASYSTVSPMQVQDTKVEQKVEVQHTVDVSTEELLKDLVASLAEELYLEAKDIDLEGSFMEMGLDSIIGVEWIRKLNKTYGLNLKTTILYEYTNAGEFMKNVTQMIQNDHGTGYAVSAKKVESEATKAQKIETAEKFIIDDTDLINKLIKTLAEELYLKPDEVDLEASFMEMGLDSIIGVEWIRKINKQFGVHINTTKLYEYTSLKEFTSYLKSELENNETENGSVTFISTEDKNLEIQEKQAEVSTSEAQQDMFEQLLNQIYNGDVNVDDALTQIMRC